jgi:hypothetical protein
MHFNVIPNKRTLEVMKNVLIKKLLHKYSQPIAMSELTQTGNKHVLRLYLKVPKLKRTNLFHAGCESDINNNEAV